MRAELTHPMCLEKYNCDEALNFNLDISTFNDNSMCSIADSASEFNWSSIENSCAKNHNDYLPEKGRYAHAKHIHKNVLWRQSGAKVCSTNEKLD